MAIPKHLKQLLAEARERGLCIAAQTSTGIPYNRRTPDEYEKHWKKFGTVKRPYAYVLVPVSEVLERRRDEVARLRRVLDLAEARLEAVRSYAAKSK